jgi:hypothetical protein
MPSLEELFKSQKIEKGPNTGLTAKEAYAPQNSKSRDITSSNVFVKKVNTMGGGEFKKLYDVLGKVNKARQTRSITLGETLAEEDAAGLKQFAISGKPFLYGLDFFRISNQRTQTLVTMNRAASRGVPGGFDDKIGNAVGNYVGDAITNVLNNGKKAQLPPKPDFAALGTEIAIDIGDRLLGALLPNPLIPTKVATEFEKWYDSPGEGMNPDKNKNLTYEYNTDKKIIKLIEKNKVKGALSNAIKSNKNILSQTKDFLISTASSVIGGLVKAGVSSLIRKGTNKLLTNKLGNILMGNKGGQSEPVTEYTIKYSSKNEYGKVAMAETFKSVDEIGTLKGLGLYRYVSDDVRSQLANNNLLKASFTNPQIAKLVPGLKYATPESVKTDGEILEQVNVAPDGISKYITADLFNARGISNGQDFLNLAAPVQSSATVTDATQKKYDDYDFVVLKFYSTYQDKHVQFRCTVRELTETFAPSWETSKFIGNPFNFYTYNGIERSLQFTFKVFSLNALEHKNAWRRLNYLASLTYPQDYQGMVGAVAPPLIKFTLGDMYKQKDAIIDSLSYSVDETIPWEIGTNAKLAGPIFSTGPTGFSFVPDLTNAADVTNHKLPMIISVDITLKFLESRNSLGKGLYGYSD